MSARDPLVFPPGLFYGVDIADYHRAAGISKTGLDHINKSPASYYAHHLDPARPPEKERAGQLEGNLAHCAILEPDQFDARYVVLPEDAPRKPTAAQWAAKAPSADSKAAMEWWQQFSAANHSRTVITADQHAVAMAQAASVRKIPDVAAALSVGRPEVTAVWTDPETGVLCRCRPDWVHDCGPSGVVLLDIKTYSDASPDEFRRQVARKRYHVQNAFYADGYAQASGRRVLGFVFVAVETEWPFFASATLLTSDRTELTESGPLFVGGAIEQGRREYQRNLATYKHCTDFNEWPGFPEIQTIDLPAWAYD